MIVLQTKQLIKIYGGKNDGSSTYALNGVDMRIESGEFVGVMGPSGSGKTTLLNILGGIDKPTSGTVKIMDKNIEALSKDELAIFRRKKLGFVFQEFNLMDSLTLKENVMLPMILDKKKVDIMEAKTKEIMEFFEIYDICDKYPYNISGGQQQRVAASRALVNEPDIILADEPTGNLDSKSSNNVMKCLEKINEERNSTILMVTHDPFAASFCKRIIFIKDGNINMEIVRKGDRKEFFDRILDCQAIVGGDRNDI
ncbi:ABC transporter ATP-binding protein [Clostridium estertheticum]|uniref:ABC transporter ATP-binding protein n=1 Tax=Clostridium estertheticum TaxID=238834 RepID=UPI0013E955FF|nr:ABC transporter ATP-binding protein [Clostridium estertheticum]MBZ9685607.1 ABC transporter ATP-binding protein [Clostridium estertheticum]